MTDQTKALTIRERTDKIIDPILTDIGSSLGQIVPVEKFKTAFLTAATVNPEIFKCDPNSVRTALLKCAQDGLVPDGRQAALVPFNTKVKDQYVTLAQYMPMVQGIIKRAAELGEIRNINANCVYENDKFVWHQGDDEKIEHTPSPLGSNRGNIIGVYAIFMNMDGAIIKREVMDVSEVERARSVSRAKDGGPWSKWASEMYRKTVIRRGAKTIPMSDKLRQIIERDDEMVDFNQVREELQHKSTLRDRLREAGAQAPRIIDHITEQTGEIILDQEPERVPVEADPFDDDFPGNKK